MIVLKIIVTLVIFLSSAIFLSNATTALIQVKIVEAKTDKPKVYWNSNLLLFCGFMTFTLFTCFLVLAVDNIESEAKQKDKPKYELIQEEVYRKLP